jgi:hypothetical protein
MWEPFPPAPPPPQYPRPRRRFRPLVYGLLGVVALIVVGRYVVHPSNVINPRASRVSTIQALPEATLLMPGSHVLSRSASGPANLLGLGTVSDAAVFTVAGVDASYEQIFMYFKQQLGPRAWQGPVPDGIDSPQWTKGHYVFSLVWAGPGDPTFPGEAAYTTTYVVAIRYSSQTAPAPASAPTR